MELGQFIQAMKSTLDYDTEPTDAHSKQKELSADQSKTLPPLHHDSSKLSIPSIHGVTNIKQRLLMDLEAEGLRRNTIPYSKFHKRTVTQASPSNLVFASPSVNSLAPLN